MSEQEPEVLARLDGAVGRLTLNRPKALHALTLGMCELMTEALLAWRDDPAVELILLDHAGERGFCAGGDIRMLAESAIHREHPGLTPEKLRVRLAVRLYGRELAERVLGPAPPDAR